MRFHRQAIPMAIVYGLLLLLLLLVLLDLPAISPHIVDSHLDPYYSLPSVVEKFWDPVYILQAYVKPMHFPPNFHPTALYYFIKPTLNLRV